MNKLVQLVDLDLAVDEAMGHGPMPRPAPAVRPTLCAKFSYADKRAAISQLNRIRHARGVCLHAYHCSACCAWHIAKDRRE